MNRFLIFLLYLCGFCISCNNDEEPEIQVTYEVLTTGGVKWSGEFDDENGDRIITFQAFGGLSDSGWTYTFVPKQSPTTLTIHGTAECPECNSVVQREPSEDITVNIYINGVLKQTQTNGCRDCTTGPIKGLATAWMNIPEEL